MRNGSTIDNEWHMRLLRESVGHAKPHDQAYQHLYGVLVGIVADLCCRSPSTAKKLVKSWKQSSEDTPELRAMIGCVEEYLAWARKARKQLKQQGARFN